MFTLEQAMNAQGEEVEVWLYSFFNLGVRWGWVVNTTPWSLYPQEGDPVPTVQEAGWAQGRCRQVRKIFLKCREFLEY